MEIGSTRQVGNRVADAADSDSVSPAQRTGWRPERQEEPQAVGTLNGSQAATALPSTTPWAAVGLYCGMRAN